MNILVSDTISSDVSSMSYRVSGSFNPNPVVKAKKPETIKEIGERITAGNTPTIMVDISSQGRAALAAMTKLPKAASEKEMTAAKNPVAEALKTDRSQSDTQETSRNRFDISGLNGQTEEKRNVSSDSDKSSFINVAQEEKPEGTESGETTPASSRINLSLYSESQLRSLLREGTISTGELNKELALRVKAQQTDIAATTTEDTTALQAQPVVLQQALAAYNFQMSFSNGQVAL